ncbi:MAG: hypothetical protein IJB86_01080 [Clostridia bacterium]|nr:hypothetical protein [Clostridia bacterium]
MRVYRKPELNIEFFEVEDVITVSAAVTEEETYSDVDVSVSEEFSTGISDTTSVPDVTEEPTTEKPSDTTREPVIFEEEVMGGNPVQEVLNNLYDNFIQIF